MMSTKKKAQAHESSVMNTQKEESADTARARQTYLEALKTATPDEIMAGLQRALASQEWGAGPLGEGIPPAADWLRSKGWERRYTPEARC